MLWNAYPYHSWLALGGSTLVAASFLALGCALGSSGEVPWGRVEGSAFEVNYDFIFV